MEGVILLYLINEDASWLVRISNLPLPLPLPVPYRTRTPTPLPLPLPLPRLVKISSLFTLVLGFFKIVKSHSAKTNPNPDH